MTINKGYLTAKTEKDSDAYDTPIEAINPILKYLQKFSERVGHQAVIWCPFDLQKSNYVKVFAAAGYEVLYSHIDTGENFFFYEPDEPYDIIISNPPFSIKDDILRRLEEIGKPYAILLPLPSWQGQSRFEYLKNSESIHFNKRVKFLKDGEVKTSPAFASSYLCKGFLEPNTNIWEELK